VEERAGINRRLAWTIAKTNRSLYSMVVSTEKAGYEAAEVLDKIMAGKKVVNQTIVVRPTHVVAR